MGHGGAAGCRGPWRNGPFTTWLARDRGVKKADFENDDDDDDSEQYEIPDDLAASHTTKTAEIYGATIDVFVKGRAVCAEILGDPHPSLFWDAAEIRIKVLEQIRKNDQDKESIQYLEDLADRPPFDGLMAIDYLLKIWRWKAALLHGKVYLGFPPQQHHYILEQPPWCWFIRFGVKISDSLDAVQPPLSAVQLTIENPNVRFGNVPRNESRDLEQKTQELE
ncbi:hypothetical protein O988_02744 [Pseudogymnoascus sp. VKM F-3808]|nr:hypothetical protein O988_02744 [Pseudogymnoascus sp. VKM F-3808]